MELDQFINETCQTLSQSGFAEINSIGLRSGKTGTAILCAILSNYSDKEYWSEKSQELLIEISEGIGSIEKTAFADGLAGVGWGIEWLKQNGFLKVNTDDILEEIDDLIYKVVIHASDDNISKGNGALGNASYFLKRYQSINPGTHRFKTICHQECLVLLTDDIKERVSKMVVDINNSPTAGELIDMADILIFISEFWTTRINMATFEDILYTSVKYAENWLQKLAADPTFLLLSQDIQDGLFKLAYAYQLAGLKVNCQHWQAEGTKYLTIILEVLERTALPFKKPQYALILSQVYRQTYSELCYRTLIDITGVTNIPALPATLNNGLGEILLAAINCSSTSSVIWNEV